MVTLGIRPLRSFLERLALDSRPHRPRAATPAASSSTEETQRIIWAELLERTFAVDVLRCSYCGGRRRRIAVITDPLTCRMILRHIGARCDPQPLAPARPQLRFTFASAQNLSSR